MQRGCSLREFRKKVTGTGRGSCRILRREGSIDIDARAYALHWVISFSDNWFEQIEQIRDFLRDRGISVCKPRRVRTGGWTFEVKEIASMKSMAVNILQSGGSYRKKRELQLLVDYYSDKITGTEVLEAFDDEVRRGIRVGKLRIADMPYTHFEGLARARYASRFEQRVLTIN